MGKAFVGLAGRQEDASAWDRGSEISHSFNVSVVFASGSPLLVEFHPSEYTLFAFYFANELDYAMHAARHIHRISNIEVLVANVIATDGSVCHPWGSWHGHHWTRAVFSNTMVVCLTVVVGYGRQAGRLPR